MLWNSQIYTAKRDMTDGGQKHKSSAGEPFAIPFCFELETPIYSSKEDAPFKTNRASTAFHFAAGLGSGVTSAFLLQPADLLKTRVQQSPSSSLSTALKTILAGPSPIQQLWRGTTPSVIRTGAGSALYFGMLNQLRRASSTPPLDGSGKKKLSNTANLATGAAARALAGFVMSPVTVLKVRYESSLYNYTSLPQAGRDIFRTSGAKGFFAGFGATAVRDAPYAGLYVLFYEQSKVAIFGHLDVAAPVANFSSGVMAAAAATAVTNPFDAVKTRLQLQPMRYRNAVSAARTMVAEEGARCLFDGLGIRMARKAVSSALAWTVYEELIRRAEDKIVA